MERLIKIAAACIALSAVILLSNSLSTVEGQHLPIRETASATPPPMGNLMLGPICGSQVVPRPS